MAGIRRPPEDNNSRIPVDIIPKSVHSRQGDYRPAAESQLEEDLFQGQEPDLKLIRSLFSVATVLLVMLFVLK